MIASFRHLDAVYKIDKSTGAIVWKLGGTSHAPEPDREGDPAAYTFGGQHDARLLPDGTLTVFDNRTDLDDATPRAVRFRIDQTAGTATLLQSISDPDVPASHCCGSARRLPNRDWLIDWGEGSLQGTGSIGGYKPDGTADLPAHLRLHLQLPGGAGPRGRGLGAGSAPGHGRDVLVGVSLNETDSSPRTGL